MSKNKLIFVLILLIILIFICFLFFSSTISKNNPSNKNNASLNDVTSTTSDTNISDNVKDDTSNTQNGNLKIKLIVNEQSFIATLENSNTANSFIDLLPMDSIEMKDLNSNEKYFNLTTSLPTNPSVPSMINAGDLMLYGSDTVVLFYENFNTSYSYTKIGRIDDVANLKSIIGSGNILIRFEKFN